MNIDFEADMSIDPDELDVEVLRQPDLYAKYARLQADAEHEMVLADEEVKVVRAELVREVNEDPDTTVGKPKATATDIEAYYRDHKRHREAKERWVEAAHTSKILMAAIFTLNQRKGSLDNLCRLHAQEYFAGPSVPRDLAEQSKARKQLQDDAKKKVGEGSRRRRR